MAKIKPIKVGAYWINHYKKCGQHTTDYCGSIADGFAGAMLSRGHQVAVAKSESNASPLQWTTANDSQPGGVDTVDFAVIATHGGTHGVEVPVTGWLYWTLVTFDSPDGCFASTIELNGQWRPPDSHKPVTRMRLGDNGLKWAIFDACRTLQVGVENEHDQNARAELADANPSKAWGRCFDGLHMIFGFTGLSSDAGWTATRGASFGRRAARGDALTDSWLDEADSYWADDCPAVMACGKSEADANMRLRSGSLAKSLPTLRAGDIRAFAYIWRD